jgi:RimJ/RimL family protein N-acetyltransferase
MNPVLRDIPEQIETERLLIRCPRPGDGRVVFEGVVDTLSDLRAWPASLPWALYEPSVEASELFCRESQVAYLARKTFAMLLFLKCDGSYIGGSGLHGNDWSVPKFEIGYWCRKPFQGRGLMVEAVTAITAFAFGTLGAARIVSLPDAKNLPSRRVAERAGYALEGILRGDRKTPDGTLRDTCVYATTR